jgi:hypothetical protein
MTDSSNSIYFLQFTVSPKDGHIDAQKIEGAICNCWIQADSEENALKKGEQFLLEQDWQLENIEQQVLVQATDYPEDNAGAQYFTQAQQHGFAVVFHIWSPSTQK